MAKRQANKQREIVGMYDVLDALECALGSASPERRKALSDTLKAYSEDFPDEFFWAVGPQSPTLLSHLMTVIDRDPGTLGREGKAAKELIVADGFATVDGRKGRIIAIRHYHDLHPDTGEEYDLQDYLVCWEDDGTHSVFIAGDLPGDPPTGKPLMLKEVFAWYQDCPEIIERVVVQGAGESTD